MPSRPTSRDVAKAAGVAQSTVSYVLNGKGTIAQATRDRVLRAARELNYRPNRAARAMRTRRTGRLAVVIPSLVYNPSRMLVGAGAVAEAAGYSLEVHSVPDLQSRTERIVDLAESGQIEGILTVAPAPQMSEVAPDSGVPVMTVSEFDEQMHGSGELVHAAPLATLMEGLAELGHRRFLHVAGPEGYTSARARRDLYEATVERLGVESLGVVTGQWAGSAGVEAVRQLPEAAVPLAVIAANDMLAVGVMRGAAERGWAVPGQVSVTGWDNYEVSEFLVPSLTTVDIDLDALGRRSMARLIAVLRDEEPPAADEPLQRVIWRESTAPPDGPSER